MRPGVFSTLVVIGALEISVAIYGALLPDSIKAEGPLVIVLMALSIMVIAFSVEHRLALQKMPGTDSLVGVPLTPYKTYNDDSFDEAVLQAYMTVSNDKTVANVRVDLEAHAETRDGPARAFAGIE